MSIFDQLKSKATIAAGAAINNLGNKRETFTFPVLPESVEQMKTLPEAAMDTPFKTAALTGQDISFIKDRFRGGARNYIIFSYFGGADSPRPVKLRKKADGQWCLWEQYLLTDIRQPKADDPWA